MLWEHTINDRHESFANSIYLLCHCRTRKTRRRSHCCPTVTVPSRHLEESISRRLQTSDKPFVRKMVSMLQEPQKFGQLQVPNNFLTFKFYSFVLFLATWILQGVLEIYILNLTSKILSWFSITSSRKTGRLSSVDSLFLDSEWNEAAVLPKRYKISGDSLRPMSAFSSSCRLGGSGSIANSIPLRCQWCVIDMSSLIEKYGTLTDKKTF